ncbi:hypothetical protein JZ751_021272 [Albula glossodonta]|uniref:Uncharacterized protein n=1 Tax=Albula glossodonta TaxID=121402 RepID=A0A8T2NT36_9TELE|nr:hypothetical protein JZ751_011469 [Albula glossodonta]KAG9331656.1 hypothetical protein JZ751_018477 [Albula glossodonta]KAG9340698.1 hypothetical protein JZ751_021272 [Albula glossodonta]
MSLVDDWLTKRTCPKRDLSHRAALVCDGSKSAMFAAMAAAGAVPGGGPMAQQRQLSRAVLALTLLAVTSSSLSALSLYHVLALKAEVAVLRNEITRRREEQRSTPLRQEAGEPSQDREGAFRNTSSEPGTGPSGEAGNNVQQGMLTVRKRSADQGAGKTGKSVPSIPLI